DPSKIIKTSTGNVKGVQPGGIIGAEYLTPGQTDPYQWVNKVLLPTLAKKGVTDPAKVQEIISAIASQTTTAQMMSVFATQQAGMEKDPALIAGAHGLSAAGEFMSKDPFIAFKGVTEQLTNLLQTAGGPLAPAAAAGLNALADAIARLTHIAAENPV